MRIWLILDGEPFPLGKDQSRLMRMANLAEMLAKNGHEVVWWSSNFEHYQKKHIEPSGPISIRPNYTLYLLKSCGYTRNISVRRIFHNMKVSRLFSKLSRTMPKPDLVFSAMPPIDFCYSAFRYAKTHKIPFVVDLRDMWPDFFLEVDSKLIRTLVFPYYLFQKFLLRTLCSQAHALFGISRGFLNWGLLQTNRKQNSYDDVFHMGYFVRDRDINHEEAEQFWKQYHIGENPQEFIVAFAGVVNDSFDFKGLISAFKKLPEYCKLVIAGNGVSLSECQRLAAGSENIIIPGVWLNRWQIWSLLKKAKIGVAPYKNIKNFQENITNKPIEYLSFGLPILTSLQKGEISRLIDTCQCGIKYSEEDPDDIKEKILYLMNNERMLHQMSENARNCFCEKFDGDIVYSQMIKRLEEIAKSVC